MCVELKSQAPVSLQDRLIAENRVLRQMNRNLVYTARAIHFENVMLKMKVGGLALLLPTPALEDKRADEMQKELASLENSLALEIGAAGYRTAKSRRSRRVIDVLKRDIAILKKELSELEMEKCS